jgi:hypothetical protein
MAEKGDCVLHRRAARGDVVTFTHDFVSRQATHEPAPPRSVLCYDDVEAQDHSATAQRNLQSVPSNPVVFRIREDLSWEDVLQNESNSHPTRHYLNGISPTHSRFNIPALYLLLFLK